MRVPGRVRGVFKIPWWIEFSMFNDGYYYDCHHITAVGGLDVEGWEACCGRFKVVLTRQSNYLVPEPMEVEYALALLSLSLPAHPLLRTLQFV